MAYKPRYLQYINLPRIPQEILDQLPKDLNEFKSKSDRPDSFSQYRWTDDHNEQLNQWCKENICADMYWGFQFMTNDMPKHTDHNTKTKFVYLIEPGGNEVHTRFWTDDHNTQVDDHIIKPHRWHILKVDKVHSVDGIELGSTRWSVTGRIFEA